MTIEYKDSKRIVALSTDFPPTVTTPATYEVTDTSGGEVLHSAVRTTSAEAIKSGSVLIGKTVSKVEFALAKSGSPTGTVTAGVFNSSGSLLYTFGTIDVSTISTSTSPYVWYAFENTVSTYTLSQNEYVGIRYSGGDSSNWIVVRHDDVSPPFDGTNSVWSRGYDNGNWQDFTGIDVSFKLYLATDGSKPTNVQDNSILVEKDTARRYWFDADASYTTVEAGATADSNGGAAYVTYKQITGLTAGDEISHVTFDVYNTPTDTSFKGGVYTNSGTNPTTLLASGELTNQNVSNTYTTLSIPLTSNATVPSDGKVWVAIIPNKTNPLLRVSTASSSYTNSKFSTTTGSYTNYSNWMLSTASVQGAGENNVRFGVKIYHAPAWTMQPTFQDDFSTNKGWTNLTSNTSVTTKLNYSEVSSTYIRATKDLQDSNALGSGNNMSDNFVIRFELNKTNDATNTANGTQPLIGISSAITDGWFNNQDSIGMLLSQDTNQTHGIRAVGADNQYTHQGDSADSAYTWTTGIRYCEVIKNATADTVTATLYSDSNYSDSLVTATVSTSGKTFSGLRYLSMRNFADSGRSSTVWEMNNVQVYDGVTSIN